MELEPAQTHPPVQCHFVAMPLLVNQCSPLTLVILLSKVQSSLTNETHRKETDYRWPTIARKGPSFLITKDMASIERLDHCNRLQAGGRTAWKACFRLHRSSGQTLLISPFLMATQGPQFSDLPAETVILTGFIPP